MTTIYMENKSTIITKKDLNNFKEYLQLNISDITWQGRYQKEFDDFWKFFFTEGITLGQLIKKFDYAFKEFKTSHILSWLSWLRREFLYFVFIEKNISIYDIVVETNISIRELSTILWEQILHEYPQYDYYLNNIFQISSISDKKSYIKFSDIKQELKIGNYVSQKKDNIMTSIEITLYKEWKDFIKKLRNDNKGNSFSRSNLGKIFSSQLKFIRDTVLIVLVCLFLVWAIHKGNYFIKENIIKQIIVFSTPAQYNSDDKSNVDNINSRIPSSTFDIEHKDIDNIDDNNFDDISRLENDNEYNTESEVVLTSWETSPRDISSANLEASDYEEVGQKGYRENRYGKNIVYRIIMESGDTQNSGDKLQTLIERYQVSQVDSVEPGMEVPGGIYYNLYVPEKSLSDFLAGVEEIGDKMNLYKSKIRIRKKGPPGRNRVFIWVKSI